MIESGLYKENIEKKNEPEKKKAKEQQEIGAILSDNNSKLQNIEKEVIANQSTSKHVSALKNEINEIVSDQVITKDESKRLHILLEEIDGEELYEDILELVEEGLDTDELKKLKRLGYTKADFQRLIRYYKERRDTSKESDSLSISYLISSSKSNSILDLIEGKGNENKSILAEDKTQELIAMFLEEKDKLEEEEKADLMKCLREIIMMQYLEGKQLEVYEISVDKNGNIIIKTKGGKQIIIPSQDIKVFGNDFIKNKMKEVFSDEDIKKLEKAIQKTTAESTDKAEKDRNKKQADDVKSTTGSLLENLTQNQ